MELKGLAAIVTGGGSGLGAATGRALAAAGAKVALVDINEENAKAVAAEIGGLGLRADVSSSEEMEAAVDAAAAAHGPARVLVCCAGIGDAARAVGKSGPLPLEAFERVIRVNLVGTFNCARLVAHRMSGLEELAGGERGAIIMTASVAAFEGQIGQVAYSASKGGVVGMTIPLARELAARGIRVNTIAPGLFLTPLLMGLPPAVQDVLGKSVPFPNRLGDPAEYGALARHICENAMLNGETIRLDGALRMPPK